MSALFDAVEALTKAFRALGVMPYLWPLLFVGSCILGVRIVMHHMRHGRVALTDGQIIGSRTHTDMSGATLFRSAEKVARNPSLSPFYGRPAWLRGLPPPVTVAYLWALSVAPAPVKVGTAAGLTYLIYRSVRRVRLWQHERRIVRPMTRALAPQLGMPADRILEGIVVPPDYTDPAAEITVRMPDDWRPMVLTETGRVVAERLGGEWRHSLSPHAPYVLTLSHKPSPPEHVAYEDVAEKILRGDLWKPFVGLGTEREDHVLNFDGHVVHLGISAGTGGGKSTLMRILATNFAVRSQGAAQQAYIDVKGDDEGMDRVPGMRVLNDIGDIDSLDGIYKMWDLIRSYCAEMDARRRGLRGPKESWEPLVLFADEQNAFAKFSRQAWEKVKGKSDPNTPPVWQDMYLLAVMGRSFKIRLINAYQVFSAAAAGGGNAQDGGEVRRQFGNLMMARFNTTMWDNLVGTRPRGQSSEIPGRWLHVNNAGSATAVQLPQFEPGHVVDLCSAAGLRASEALPGPSPDAVPGSGGAAPYELLGPWGDSGTGDDPAVTRPDGHGVLLPFRPRSKDTESTSSGPGTESSTGTESAPTRRYSIEQACQEGIISMTVEQAKKARTRTRQNHPGQFPEGRKEGRGPETYTADELREWEYWYNKRKAQ